ncbi:MAG: dienelactone hydrolase family protein, partial [Cyanobacteria bacterium J06641_5]
PGDGLVLDAHFASPVGPGPFPGVVVIQEIFGVNAHIRDVTERIARAGYVAVAPAIYQRQAPGFQVGYTAADLAEGRKYKEQTKASELLADLNAAIAYLKALPQCSGNIGTIGFCFGGHVVYLGAVLEDVQVIASFYGAGIATLTPGGGAPTISRTPEIKGTLYAFFGTVDPLIPNEQTDEIEAALKTHNIPHRVLRYEGANHGFFCDRRESYNAAAANDAWQCVLELFGMLRR